MSTLARIPLFAVALLLFSASSLAVTIVSDCATLGTANEYYLLNTNITDAVALTGIGDYGGCFNITADNITLDCAWYTVDGDGDEDGNGVYVGNGTKASLFNITVTNCILTQFRNGIRASNVSYSHFYHNNLSGNAGSGVTGVHAGISASNMTDSWVTYSNITGNADYGMFLLDSHRNNITNNRVTDTVNSSEYAIALQTSLDNRLWNNTVSSNEGWGILLMVSSHRNAILNNTVNANGDSSIWVSNSTDTLIRNNTIRANTGAYGGILCSAEANNTRIDNNTIVSNSGDGVYIAQSTGVRVENNTINSNEDYAIQLATNSIAIIRRNLVCQNEDGFLSNATGTTHTTQNNTMCIYDMLPANDTTITASSVTFSAMANALETMSCDFYVYSELELHGNAQSITTFYTMPLSSRDRHYYWWLLCNDTNDNNMSSGNRSFFFTSSGGSSSKIHRIDIDVMDVGKAILGKTVEIEVEVSNEGDYDEKNVEVRIDKLPSGWSSSEEEVDIDEGEEITLTLRLSLDSSKKGDVRVRAFAESEKDSTWDNFIIDVVACSSDNDCDADEECNRNRCETIACNCGEIDGHACVPYECCSDADCSEDEYCSSYACVAIPLPEEIEELEVGEIEELLEETANTELLGSEEPEPLGETSAENIVILEEEPQGDDSIIWILVAGVILVLIFILLVLSKKISLS